MVKDYIKRLLAANREEGENLEKQIQSLQNDLEKSLQWLDKIKREIKIEDNIFSPRSYSAEVDEKLEEAQRESDRIKTELKYMRERMESCLQKTQEYESLLAEVEEKDEIKIESEGTSEDNFEIKSKRTAQDKLEIENKEETEDKQKIDDKESTEVKQIAKNNIGKDKNENTAEEKENENKIQREILDDLAVVYKKIEYSLALLNGDKNRCKNELKSTLRLLKETALKIEKTQK